VETEGERTDTHLVPDKRVIRIGLHQLGADHPRVVPGMATIVDEHGPHALRGGLHEAYGGSATGKLARVGRQYIEHDHLAGGEAVLLIRGQAEGRARRRGGEAKDHGDQREDGPGDHVTSVAQPLEHLSRIQRGRRLANASRCERMCAIFDPRSWRAR